MNSILNKLNNHGIKLWIDYGNLRCKAPKGVMTEELSKAIKNNKNQLIEMLEHTSVDNKNIFKKIPTADRDERLPLSFSQERLWFLNQYEENSLAFHMPALLHLKGRLNTQALENTLLAIIERHEVLRTNFKADKGKASQYINDSSRFVLEKKDLSKIADEHIKNTIKELVYKELAKDFCLENDVLLRANLFEINENEHWLFVNMHHIISDGWSVSVLINEIVVIYEALVKKLHNPLPPLTLQYADYAAWQREYLSSDVMQEMILYWKDQLAGCIPLELPTDFSKPTAKTNSGKIVNFNIDKELSRKIELLSSAKESTPFMFFLAAFNILLHKYTNQEDILVGSPIANRNRAEIEPLIGMFINTLMLRTEFDREIKFPDLLNIVKDITLNAYKNQDVPVEKIIEALSIERDSANASLISVLFLFQNMPESQLHIEGLDIVFKNVDNDTAKADLTLELMKSGNNFIGQFEYSTDLFKKERIERMVEHFKKMLHAIVSNPELRISEYEIITKAEKEKLLIAWNNTNYDYPQDKTVIDLFEQQVEKTPANNAVTFADQKLTYSELNQKSNQLANYLISKGVKPDSRVAICVGRSLEMIVAIMGILKAGGGYMPIDPQYPTDRMVYMLEDSAVDLLITQRTVNINLPVNSLDIIYLDEKPDQLNENQSVHNPEVSISPKNMAYLIYTSGSTGKPKGVMIEHGGVVNYITDVSRQYIMSDHDRVLQFSSVSFDIFVEELFLALLNGASLVIPYAKQILDISELLKLIEKYQLTVLSLPTAYWHQLAAAEIKNISDSLRLIIVGGEKVRRAALDEWQTHHDNSIRLINTYGPTEATVVATLFDMTDCKLASVSIGRPLANTRLYLLDKNMNPVPEGVPGELYLSGVGLARGYFNQPEMTSQRFIPNPYFDPGYERLYKTGDQACYLSDGNLEFIGRIDDQVKIRGYRIEPGEIERQMARLEHIKECIVLVKEDEQSSKILLAYAVADGKELDSKQIKNILKANLPEYMIPSIITFLESLPLTNNGKVDKKALLALDVKLESSYEYVPPRNDLERKLAGIFCEVLNIKQVGIYDSFFELGGHSLKATELAAKIQQALNCELSLQKLFKNPSITGISENLKKATPNYYHSIAPIEKREYYALSSAQKRMYVLNWIDPESTHYNLPLIVKLKGRLDIEKVNKIFNMLIDRHEMFRASFEIIEGNPIQKIALQMDFTAKYRKLGSHEKVEDAVNDFVKPFDLSQSPLLRVSLVQEAEEQYVLMIDMHHIISDGVTHTILIEEFAGLYNGEKLSRLQLNYTDYAVWQQNQLSNDAIKKQEAYWLEKLSGVVPVLNLPTDYPRPAIQSYAGNSIVFEIDTDLTERLYAISRENSATLYMTILAVFNIVLFKYTGQNDIIIGSPIANRRHADLVSVVGMFVNTIVMRTKVGSDLTFKELLNQVKENALAAYDHQDFQFEDLVEKLDLKRDMSRNPLFDVMFVLHSTNAEEVKLGDLIISPYAMENLSSKFDMILNAWETGEGISFNLEYCTTLFKKTSMERFSEHFLNILKAVTIGFKKKISKIEMLGKVERLKLFNEFNDTQIDFPKGLCVQQLFEKQAGKTPEHIAAIIDDKKISYNELNQKANQLAYYLRTKGIGPEKLVAICMERSLEMMIGLLGILKAGGAYVPIDPEYPQDRILYMLADSQSSVVLTQDSLLPLLPDEKVEKICLDKDWHLIAGLDNSNVDSGVNEDNLAYVIYTSGSTGKPKGVMNQHNGIVNRLYWTQARYRLTPEDAILQKTTFSFDVSVWEFFWPLMVGCRLVFAKPGGHKDNDYLIDLIKREQITTIHFVPSMLQVMVAASGFEECTSLKRVICSGEALPSALTKRFYEKLDVPLHNLYGPTEAAIDVSSYECEKESDLSTVPIGKPVANTELYILDKDLKPVPIGVVGELYIGGIQVARGYLNREALTNEKFITNPFNSASNHRLYKTGDLVRYLADGNIEYMGRSDDQVKIRGFRIEPGEIESVINKLESIQASVVITKPDKSGYTRLVAYVVLKNSEEEIKSKEIRQQLIKIIPDYMVPAAFVVLDSMPLTPNGKINKNALPEPEGLFGISQEHVAPRNAIEQTLHDIWMEVLGANCVGIHDNFFELGGDSILAIQIVSKATQAGMALGIKDLIKYQTIEELAVVVEGNKSEIIAEQGLVSGEVINNPIQSWFFDQDFKNINHFNQAVMICVDNSVSKKTVEDALCKVVKQHDALRLRYNQEEGIWKQRFAVLDKCNVGLVDLENVPENELSNRIESYATQMQSTLSISEGPILKLILFKTAEHMNNRLLIMVHHLVVDGVSWRIMLEDLQTACRQLLKGAEVLLGRKTTSFKAWNKRLVEYANSDQLSNEIPYWKKIVSKKMKHLPVDHPAGKNSVAAMDLLTVNLDQEETDNLLHKAGMAYNLQINDFLLIALARTITRWTSSQSIRFDLEGHGREQIADEMDVTRTVGWFTSIYPISVTLDNKTDISDTLKEVKQQLRMIPNRGIGYGLLRYLHADKSVRSILHANDKTEILFNYLGQLDNTFSNSELLAEASESVGQISASTNHNTHLLGINAMVINKELTVNWSYSSNIFSGKTIQSVATNYINELQTIIKHCMSIVAQDDFKPRLSLADIPEKKITEILVPMNDGGPQPAIFAVPGNGGSILPYFDLAQKFEGEHPVYGLQDSGLDGMNNILNSIEEIAALNIKAIMNIQPEGPYHLIGHSLGGWIIFEMANQLEKLGQEVALIGILDTFAPLPCVFKNAIPVNKDLWWIKNFMMLVSEYQNIPVELDYHKLKSLNEEQRLAHILSYLKDHNIDITLNQLKGYLQVYKKNVEINYSTAVKINSRIILFKACEFDESYYNKEDIIALQKELSMGWKDFTARTVDVKMVPGNHLSMIKQPQVEKLAQSLKNVISENFVTTQVSKKSI